ncbi:unnamed protein product [Umbelopsis ramanniana]
MLIRKTTLLTVVAAGQVAFALDRRDDTSDLQTILANVNQLTFQNTPSPGTTQWLETLQADGSFSDVNYVAGCAGDRANWGAEVHWSHVLDMTVSWGSGAGNGTDYKNSSTLLTSIKSAMDYWFANDYTNEGCTFGNGGSTCPCGTPGLWGVNWWFNVIGVPKIAGAACAVVSDQLNTTQIAGCQRITKRPYAAIPQETAANLIDVSLGSVYYGLISRNTSILSKTFSSGNSALQVTNGQLDGIKVDGSFFQHGGLLASGSYGAVMFQGFLNLQTFAMGTAYQANTTQQSAFALVMNGSEWMVYSNSSGSPLWDYSVTGRSLSRPGAATDIAVNLKQLVNATSNWSTGSQFAKIVKTIQTPSHDANNGPFNGNKMFYYGDYMVHRRSNYIVTLKMTSNRTLAEECVNGESSKGFHLSDGTLYTYLSGDEYRNIFPTWDWDLIPGTTIDYRGTPNNCTPAYLGSNAFAGGVSNGQIGVAGLNYKNPKTKDFSWKKSWFFLNDFYVVLGSNISETRPNPVFSTLDQRKLNGKVYIGNDHRPATTGLYKDVKWIHHDSIGYQMLDSKVSVNLSTSVQSGTWQSIGAYNGSVSLPVFNAKIVHQQTSGQAVQNAELGYVVYPGMSRSKFISHTRHSPVSVLQRNDVAHIIQIESEKFVGAVFWSAGNASIPLFSKVRSPVVVSSGIVFSALTGSNSVLLMVADPTQMLSSVQLTVDTRGKSLHCPKHTAFSCSVKSSSTTVITVSLPQGATAGSTVQGEFKIGGSFSHS